MSKVIEKYNLDDDTKGLLKELTSEMDAKFTADLEKSQEEVIKMKEGFAKMGIDFDKLSTEDAKLIKSIKAGGQATAEKSPEARLKALGGMLGAFAGGKGSIQVAKEQVEGWDAMARTSEEKEFIADVKKAVNQTTFQGGGAVVPSVYSNDFIMALRNQEFMSKIGIRRVNFMGGQYVIGKHNAGVTGGYVGETQAISKDAPKFGDVILTPKKAGVIVPIANEWLRNADAGAFQNVTQDAINAMEELTGSTFLEGTGTQHTPKGLAKLVNASNLVATAGTSVANIVTDVLKGRNLLSADKINIRKPVLIMNPAQETHLMGLRDNGQWVFRDEMLTGTLFGAPYFATTAAPVASSKSKLYYFDADKIYEASNRNLEMAQSDSATFTNNAGSTVNAFEQDMSLMRLIYSHDFGTQYDTAITIVYDVAWGN